MPEVIADLGKDKTMKLFNMIIEELKKHGLYTDDVLPEYIILLITNRHPKDKIMSDLEGLISGEFARQLTNWIFQEIERLKVEQVENFAHPQETVSQPQQVIPSVVIRPDISVEQRSKAQFTQNRLFSTALKEASTSVLPIQSNKMQIDTESRNISREVRQRGRSSSRRQSIPEIKSERLNLRSKSPVVSESRRIRKPYMDEREPELETGSQRVVRRVVGDSISVDFTDARELLSRTRKHRQAPMEVDPEGHADFKHRRTYKKAVPVGDGTQNESAVTTPPQVRCQYFPNCTAGEACKFHHPTEQCKYFPNCTFGERCLYIHPSVPCKYQQMCQNPLCNYTHVATGFTGGVVQPPSTVTCKFYPNCMNPSCPFVHPIDVPCKFGEQCQRPGCHFTHPANHVLSPKSKINIVCHFGKNCAKPDCPYQHPHRNEASTNAPMPLDSEMPATSDQMAVDIQSVE